MEEKTVGRPLKYKTPKKMQKAIDKYFKNCESKPLLDEKGHVLTDKHGNPVIIQGPPPTITGLALALGFTNRQSLLNYQEKDEFFDTITRAKARVEQYAEERLFDKDGANGAKFSLANNFKGWKEKQNIEVSSMEKEKTKLDDLLEQMRGDALE